MKTTIVGIILGLFSIPLSFAGNHGTTCSGLEIKKADFATVSSILNRRLKWKIINQSKETITVAVLVPYSPRDTLWAINGNMKSTFGIENTYHLHIWGQNFQGDDCVEKFNLTTDLVDTEYSRASN